MKYSFYLLNIIILSIPHSHRAIAKAQASQKDNRQIANVGIFPKKPLIEKDKHGQYINFDITLHNTSDHTLLLSAIEISVIDNTGDLILRKSLNSNGRAPSIDLVGNRLIKPGETISLFNPFYAFAPDIPLSKLEYDFQFNYADSDRELENNKARLPIDFDASVKVTIAPKLYSPKTKLYLPLKGKIIVWDGHDFYAHHRRFPVGLPAKLAMGITANSNRYAYDFISINNYGNMYKSNPFKKENWYVFGKPVYAPGAGKVIESQNNIPDNEFGGKLVKQAGIPDSADPLGMGNHVIIDHGNGEYSVLLHMEKGSLKFKRGDFVQAGQQIGNVGFSGDAIFPHVHYTVIDGPKELVSEGLPSYFHQYRLFTGKRVHHITFGRVDTGDIIESEK